MANQEFQKQNLAQLLQNHQSIAVQLQASKNVEDAKEALLPIESQADNTQVAFLKELAKEKTIEAANITQAIHTLTSSKEVRKEARRCLIQLEGNNIYATWTPPELPKLTQAIENAIHDRSFAKSTLVSELEEILAHGDEILGRPASQSAVETFLEYWGNQEFEEAYTCLAQESPLKEGLSQEDWATRRTSWANNTQPNDIQIMFITSIDDENTSEQQKFVDVGSSIQLATIQPLVECPQPVISFPETGRSWFWLRYTLVQEDDQWVIQTITNEAAAAIMLPPEELLQKIRDNGEQIQKVSQEIEAEIRADEDEVEDDLEIDFVDAGPAEVGDQVTVIDEKTKAKVGREKIIEEVISIDTDDEDDEDEDEEEFEHEMDLFTDTLDHMDSLVRLVSQNLYYYDAIFAQNPTKYAEHYKEAFNLASTIADAERAAVYARQASEHAPEERSDALRNLAISYQALALRYHNEDDHEEEARIDALIEPTMRQALAIEESPDNQITLATILIQREKNLEEAEALLIKAQKGPLSPEGTASIELGLGEIALFNEEEEKALQHFEKLVQLEPDDEQAWYRIGYLHHQLDNIDEAIDALNKCIDLDPEVTEAYTELAGIYLTQGKQQKAREITLLGLEENPQAADMYATMALVYMQSSDYRNANKYLLQAEELDSEDEFVQIARQRYNIENKARPAQKKSQPKQKQKKAKKR